MTELTKDGKTILLICGVCAVMAFVIVCFIVWAV